MINKIQDESFLIDINTTPLIDVLLVLLAILIITIPVQLNSISIKLNDNPNIEVRSKSSSVIELEVISKHQYIWQLKPIGYSQVLQNLATAAEQNHQIIIKAHPNSKYHEVLHIINKANNFGIKSIGIYN